MTNIYVPVFKPMDNKISCGGFSVLGGGISNKTIDLTPFCFGMWVIDKEDAIAGNKKNVHFSRIPYLQLANFIDDSIKGDFSRFPSGGQVLNAVVINNFVRTKVAPSFGLCFKGYKDKSKLTHSEQFLEEYWRAIQHFFSESFSSLHYCYALSTQGMSQYLIVDTQPTQSGRYLYCNAKTGENELIEI